MSAAPHAVTHPAKQFATCQARAALLLGMLYGSEDDRGEQVYIVTLHAVTRQFRTLDDVEAWLDRVEGRR